MATDETRWVLDKSLRTPMTHANVPAMAHPTGLTSLVDDSSISSRVPSGPRGRHFKIFQSRSRRTQDPDWEEWKRVEHNLRRTRLGRIGETGFKRSEAFLVPETFEQFKEHRRAFREIIEDETGRRMIAAFQEDLVRERLNLFDFRLEDMPYANDGLGTVLGYQTIWTPVHRGLNPYRPVAEWPTLEELREEGDERHTSQFGRFLPLPRDPSNSTINWKQRDFLEPESFDKVSPVPLCEEIWTGLGYDRNGIPYDDHAQPGLTAYTEKNPFDPLIRFTDGMSKISADFKRRAEAVHDILNGKLSKTNASDHFSVASNLEHRDLNQQSRGDSPLSCKIPAPFALSSTIKDKGTENEINTGSSGTITNSLGGFPYNPNVQIFIPGSFQHPSRDCGDINPSEDVKADDKVPRPPIGLDCEKPMADDKCLHTESNQKTPQSSSGATLFDVVNKQAGQLPSLENINIKDIRTSHSY